MAMTDATRVDTTIVRKAAEDLISTLKRQIDQTTDPRAQVLFETSAEVIKGLVTAFKDYDEGKETAFKR
jgi:hypothetical protein